MTDKILITGFEPFGNQKINPSQILLEHLKSDPKLKSLCDFLLLPVDYEKAAQALTVKLQSEKWSGWIGFGQAGGRDKISLERVALNWKEKDFNQIEGQSWTPAPLVPGAVEAFINPINLVKILEELRKVQIPSEISFSAGTYICNCVYYFANKTFRDLNSSAFRLFVHVPYLPEQSFSAPTMPLETMLEAAQLIIHHSREA
jgi:pyroglutamyl-peptidase